MKPSIKRKIRKIISPFRRIGLKNKSFSIISNNCWGGFVYDIFGLQYLSPTIGCYFFAEDYIRFISNLKNYLSLEIKAITLEQSTHKEELIKRNQQNVPMAVVGDIEIYFVHYDSIEDAISKWNKRKKRVNYNNLIIKFNDQNLFDNSHFVIFDKLPYDNKLFFTADESLCTKEHYICFKMYSQNNYVLDDIKPSLKYLNIKKYINKIK